MRKRAIFKYRGYFLEIQCRDPDAVSGVTFQISTHSVGGVAHYSCPRGHTMQGNATRICLQKGTWSGQAPACIRKFIIKFNKNKYLKLKLGFNSV